MADSSIASKTVSTTKKDSNNNDNKDRDNELKNRDNELKNADNDIKNNKDNEFRHWLIKNNLSEIEDILHEYEMNTLTLLNTQNKNYSKLICDSRINTNTKLMNKIIVSMQELHKSSNKNIMKNPLVILLGISEFKNETCCRLEGIKYDMIALRRLFQGIYGYTVYSKGHIMYWDENMVKTFWKDAIFKYMLNKNNNKLIGIYDGIIIIISSHGGDNIIYDSNENEHNLYDIYRIFGEDNPDLLQIPRLFIIDACRGSDEYGTLQIGKGNKIDYEEEKEEKKEEIIKIHKGSNRATFFGQSPGIQSFLSFNCDEPENEGCSFFIRSLIKQFKKYYNDKSTNCTPNLSEILEDVGIELNLLSKGKQIPYKNGAAKLDGLQIFKYIDINQQKINNNNNAKILINKDNKHKNIIYDKNSKTVTQFVGDMVFKNNVNELNDNFQSYLNQDDHSKDNKWYKWFNDGKGIHIDDIFEFDEYFRTWTASYSPIIAVQTYRTISDNELEDDKIIDVSSYSDSELSKKIKNEEIAPQVPVGAQVKNITVTKEGSTLYQVCKRGSGINFHIGIKLRSICSDGTKVYNKNTTYGSLYNAQKHRYIKITVRNDSSEYRLRLLTSKKKMYLHKCKFLTKVRFVNLNVKEKYEASMSHSFYIIGERFDVNNDLYDTLGETGVIGALQYAIKDIQTNKDTGKRLVIAFTTFSLENPTKNLLNKKPYFDIWICEKSECNVKKLTNLVQQLKSSDSKNKNMDILADYGTNYKSEDWTVTFAMNSGIKL